VDRGPVTQAMSPTEFASAVTAITSAFGDPSRRAIYLFVHERSAASVDDDHDDEGPDGEPADGGDLPGATAAEVAARFDLHPNVARHHLDKLVAGGYVEVATDRARSGAGRPSKRYRVRTPEMSLEFPVRHDDLLVTLLGKALSMLPREEAEAMAEEVGTEYGKVLASAMGSADTARRSFRTALHAVADALTAHGFAAHAESNGDELRIVSDHCPFGGAAIEHPVICAVDRGLVKGMLGSLYGETGAETRVSLPTGGDHCETAIRN
jgi:predicted ArsR family transcriptional regulator